MEHKYLQPTFLTRLKKDELTNGERKRWQDKNR